MVSPQRKIGNLGEDIACKYLKKKGYKILEQNYEKKSHSGGVSAEIDVIAKKKGVISFVEVKSASTKDADFPLEQRVNYKKQQKIIKASENWLMKNNISLDSKWQIDIIAVNLDFASRKAKIKHFKNAFY